MDEKERALIDEAFEIEKLLVENAFNNKNIHELFVNNLRKYSPPILKRNLLFWINNAKLSYPNETIFVLSCGRRDNRKYIYSVNCTKDEIIRILKLKVFI